MPYNGTCLPIDINESDMISKTTTYIIVVMIVSIAVVTVVLFMLSAIIVLKGKLYGRIIV